MGKTHDSVFSEYHLFPLIIISFLKSQPFFHILQKKQPVPFFSKLLRGYISLFFKLSDNSDCMSI